LVRNPSRPWTGAIACAILGSTLASGQAFAAPTNFLNKPQLVGAYAPDTPWYTANIPFLEISNPQIQQIYYYRWSLLKSHIRSLGNRRVFTEFLNPMGWDQKPSNTIPDAAGFHITEGRWLKDRAPVNEYVSHWYGSADPRQYSEWIGDAAYQKYLVDSDRAFLVAKLGDMKRVYTAWNDHFDSARGLYWQVPLSDATEYTIASIDASGGADGFGGGDGYRPSINSYMLANARAISQVALLAGDTATSTDYANKANALKAAMQASLWNPTLGHFTDRYRVSNAYVQNWNFVRGRELVGFVPWYHNIPDNNTTLNSAWQHVMDTSKFYGTYGLRTTEPSYQYYMRQYRYDAATGLRECQWNGPSWPYQTTQVLGGMANLLNNYTQSHVTSADYLKVLNQYTQQHYKNGVPYLVENYHPDQGGPIVDLPERSQHYFHSAYADLVISGLVGLRPRADDTLEVNPLIPTNPADPNYISYFLLEDVSYHGHSITILWDANGTRYNQGAGLSIYVDGIRTVGPSALGRKTVALGAPIVTPTRPDIPNLAVNVSGQGYPTASASYSYGTDPARLAIDGRTWYYRDTKNRWSSFGSGNTSDWFAVDFGAARTVSSAKLHFFADDTGLKAPAGYSLQSWNGTAWVDITGLSKSPVAAAGNTVNTVTFPAVNTSRLRVVFTHTPGFSTGLAEFEVFGSGVTSGSRYHLVNLNSAKVLGVSGMSTADGATAVQFSDNGTADHSWVLELQANGYYKIRNALSNKVLGVTGMSTGNGAQVVQWADTGTADHDWRVEPADADTYRIINRNSGKLLAITNSATTDGAVALQWTDTGSADQRWALTPETGLVTNRVYRIVNQNSAKVLGVTSMSTAEAATVIQWADSGTADHNWRARLLRDGRYVFTNVNSGKVLGIEQMLGVDGARAVQTTDSGAVANAWKVVAGSGGAFKLVNGNSTKVLGVDQMKTVDGANALQWNDNATADQLWRFVLNP
jgi:hypothetical protein